MPPDETQKPTTVTPPINPEAVPSGASNPEPPGPKTETKVEQPKAGAAPAAGATTEPAKPDGASAGAPPSKAEQDIVKSITGEESDEELEKLLDDKGVLKNMPFKALKTRINRATNAELTKWFGTTDRNDIKKKLDNLNAAAAELEKQRREKLDENARLKEDLEREKREKEEYKLQKEQEDFDREYAKVEGATRAAAGEHVAEKWVGHAFKKFRKHVKKSDDAEVERLTKDPKLVSEWFKDFAERNPELAKKPGEPAKADEKKAGDKAGEKPKTVLVTNGGKDQPPPAPQTSGTTVGKRVKDMTPAEFSAHKRSIGIHE